MIVLTFLSSAGLEDEEILIWATKWRNANDSTVPAFPSLVTVFVL
jgi:hypothetical protein